VIFQLTSTRTWTEINNSSSVRTWTRNKIISWTWIEYEPKLKIKNRIVTSTEINSELKLRHLFEIEKLKIVYLELMSAPCSVLVNECIL